MDREERCEALRQKRRREDRRLIASMIGLMLVGGLAATALAGCATQSHPCQTKAGFEPGTPPYDECEEFYDYWTDKGERVVFRDRATGEEL